MGTPHNEAAQGAFAKTVLMPGDPLRAKFIAEHFLDGAKLVNNVRGVQGYTGTYRDTPVSVMASGMGMPSMGIYSYELFHTYDVDNIIRVGSVGSISPRLKLRDVVLGQAACTVSDNLLTGEALSTTERQTSFTQMITLALEVAVDMAARRA